MKKYLTAFCLVLSGSGIAQAQGPWGVFNEPGYAPAEAVTGPTVWGGGEYLLWRIKDGRANTPLASSRLDYGEFSGVGATLGTWLNPGHTFGIEGRGLLTEKRGADFADATGLALGSTSRLWGGEGNLIGNVWRTNCFALDGLLGFRYFDLDEDLGSTFAGARDSFATRNQFYGIQPGFKASVASERLSLDVTARCALGVNHQSVEVAAGGFLAPLGSGGRITNDHFSVLPSAQARASVAIFSNLWLGAGYDFIYITHVVRPGDQIAPTAFSPQRNSSDFFVHGVTFTVELKF